MLVSTSQHCHSHDILCVGKACWKSYSVFRICSLYTVGLQKVKKNKKAYFGHSFSQLTSIYIHFCSEKMINMLGFF